MAIEIFPTAAKVERTYETNAVLSVGVSKFAQSASEQRWSWYDREFAPITIPILVTSQADKDTVDAFVRTVGSQRDSWLFTDSKTFTYTGLALGSATASQTLFTIPTTGDGAGFYPVSVANTTLYDDGSPINITAVGTDARTITTDAVVAASSVMTADFASYYRRVRFARNGVGPWSFVGGTVWRRTFRVVEVPA